MIRIESEDSFPHGKGPKDKRFAEIWEAAERLRRLAKDSCIVVTVPKDVTHQEARKKAHAVFQRDSRWNIVTKIRDGEMWMRKEKVKA